MLIFLDIDGVMLPANSWRKPEILEDGFMNFSQAATIALQKIISETTGDIILTTSHKSKYSINKWKNIFKNRNIIANNFSKLPENTLHLNRKDEILNWLNANNIYDNFIIIDDDKSLNELPVAIKDKLIQTNSSIGLTEQIAENTLKTLKEKVLIHS